MLFYEWIQWSIKKLFPDYPMPMYGGGIGGYGQYGGYNRQGAYGYPRSSAYGYNYHSGF